MMRSTSRAWWLAVASAAGLWGVQAMDATCAGAPRDVGIARTAVVQAAVSELAPAAEPPRDAGAAAAAPAPQRPGPPKPIATASDPAPGGARPPPARVTPPTATPVDAEPGPCESEIRIAALVYDRQDPRRSMAVLRGGECAGGRTVHLGSYVGERRVAEIAPRAVRLKSRDAGCWIGMFTPRAREKVARETALAAKRTPRASGPVTPPSRAEMRAGITQLEAMRFRVARNVLERSMARPGQFVAAFRLQPVRDGARTAGMKVGSAPRGTLLARLGIQAGDVLRTLNGHPVTDRAAMAAGLAALARTPRITLALERDSRLLRFDYQLY